MYNDHSTLKYLVNKSVLGGHIYRWLLLFQEYEFEVVVQVLSSGGRQAAEEI